MKKIYLFLAIIFCTVESMAQEVINTKGTKVVIDSSKWKSVGPNIYYKNAGNVGIGTNNPTAQLHTTSTVRLQGIGTNTTDTKILTADAAGNVTTRSISSFPTNVDSTTANNGLTLIGKNVQLGGSLTQGTAIANNGNALKIATGGADFNITGLTAGSTATDSLLTVNATTGKINRINITSLNKNDSTTSNNGLTLTGKNVQLGGNLTQATTITNNANPLTIATGGTALNITGLTAGAATDSLVTVNAATGKINRINIATINKVDSTTSNNGLTLTGKNVQLGGNLTQATTITNNANPLTIATGGTALNITGLTAGAATDSLVTVNAVTGKINRINIATINKVDSTTAENGLTLSGKAVQLGGVLTLPTTITNNEKPLTFATGGTALNITGLPSGTIADSILVQNNTTGQLKKLNTADLQTKVVQVIDIAGTQVLTNTFANLNLGFTTIVDPDFTVGTGTITVLNAGVYRVTYRVTANVTNNTNAGGEYRLAVGALQIPGSLGYTLHNNANTSQGTTTVVLVAPIPANTTIALQGRTYSTTGTLRLTANGTSFLIEKIR
jgi:hypothetical protein